MDYQQEVSCTVCKKKGFSTTKAVNRRYSGVLSLLVLLLPKCPFCVVAYTSSMAICGAPSLVDHYTGWGAWLAIGLTVLCVGSIARNYRGTGTHTALGIALLGTSFLCAGLFYANALGWYYVGAMLLFLAGFYNGRGYTFIRRYATQVWNGHRFRSRKLVEIPESSASKPKHAMAIK
jgi:hypothetical protein